MDKVYDPKKVEERIYSDWVKKGLFSVKIVKNKRPFVMVMPPPNITGSLHMGHALNLTIQDVLIRYKRMLGEVALWVPGTDHAGIATQVVVEKELGKRGKTRFDLGKEQFIEKVKEWREKYGFKILDQFKKLGISADWSRLIYTMDPAYVKAVETAFLHYYKKGWVYKGERIINWCSRCATSLSDLEIIHVETKGKLYFIKYLIKDGGFVTVATSRPETMLGDTAVAVHNKDSRYASLAGKLAILPLLGREIPIVTDSLVNKDFGSGAVKVTPAHDPIDFEIASHHQLPLIRVINEEGKITKEGGPYANLDKVKAREKILEDLKKGAFLEKEENYQISMPTCYRCNSLVEPLVSKQWFLKMDKLALLAANAVKEGAVTFIPKRWAKVYLNWLKNVKDWNISRQIWWGHKIPLPGEEDVLDTWFSSALWSFAVFGWPKKTADLKYFYPTTVLSTARDIINLWVSRLVFSGLEFMGKEPFSKVYVHPTIFNIEGKRMSKSLGTGIDPIDLIEKYGADATRFGLMYINTGTQDIKFSEDAIIAARNFANKLWNIARFILSSESGIKTEAKLGLSDAKFNPFDQLRVDPERSRRIKIKNAEDKWILEELEKTRKKVTTDIEAYRFGQAAHSLYDFVWHKFADIYIEKAKKRRSHAQATLEQVLETCLITLHPFMPFITEELWQRLKGNSGPIMLTKWPRD